MSEENPRPPRMDPRVGGSDPSDLQPETGRQTTHTQTTHTQPRIVVAPGADVPILRREARSHIGPDQTPMVEVDSDGRIVYVGGDWQTVTGQTKPGAAGLNALFAGVDEPTAARRAVENVLAGADGAIFARRPESGTDPGVAPTYLSVVPIPSPGQARQVHALVGITENPAIALALPHSVAKYRLNPADVAAVDARRRELAASFEPSVGREDKSHPSDLDLSLGPTRSLSDEAPVLVSPGLARSFEVDASGSYDPTRPDAAIDDDLTELASAPAHSRRDRGLRSDGPRPTALLADDTQPATVAEADAMARAATAETTAAGTEQAQGGALELAGIGLAMYVAFQALYLGPTYGWPSPINAILERGACLIGPLCDNRVLLANHVGVISLVVVLGLIVARFIRTGTAGVRGARPIKAAGFASDRWNLTIDGPGIFVGLAGLALVTVIAPTLLGGSASTYPWLAAIGFGAVSAWRADRDAYRPLGATLAGLTFAVGLLLTTLGIGGIWLGHRLALSLVLALFGLVGLARAVQLAEAARSSFDRFDWAAMAGLSVLALVLGLTRHRSWRYAFVGDEWIFFQGAYDRIRGNETIGTFEIGGPNDYFTGLTFELQAAVMNLAGPDVWGWRLSALMPMVLSVPAIYAFTRWLGGRRAAVAAAAALATGHMLLSFSMVPYNNSQSLVAVSASFAALAWAHQRPSALRFYVLGAAAGSTFVVYAMARLALVPLVVLFVLLFRDDLWDMWRRLIWVVLGGLAVGAPAIFSWQNWQALLKATPVEAEVNVRESGVFRQLLENTIGGWLTPFHSGRDSHYIVGPHLDIISAVLLLVGLAWAIVRSRRDPALRWFLIAGFGLWTLINAVQQYNHISNTRSFMVPLITCVFVGLGTHALVDRVSNQRGGRPSRIVAAALALFVVVLALINQWHIGGHANENQSLTAQAMLIEQFEDTESIDGSGMPVYVGWPEADNNRLTMLLRAHGVDPERIHITGADGELPIDRLCGAGAGEPHMVVLHNNHAHTEPWRTALESCWGQSGIEISDPYGAPRALRLTNAAGLAEFGYSSQDRFHLDGLGKLDKVAGPDGPDQTEGDHDRAIALAGDVRNVVDLAVDGDGVVYALTLDGRSQIHRLDTGESISLAQQAVVDFDITATGHFVVGASGGEDRLVWYDGQGNPVARYRGQQDMAEVGGVAVAGDQIWITDPSRARAYALRANTDALEVIDTRTGSGTLADPGAISPGPDQSVWIYSGGSAQIVRIDADDERVAQIDAVAHSAVLTPRITSTAAGELVVPLSREPAIRLYGVEGRIVDEVGGMLNPSASTPAGSAALVVSNRVWHEQQVLAVGERWSPGPGRGVVRWGHPTPMADRMVEFDSPFGPTESNSGAIDVELGESIAVEVAGGQAWQQIGQGVLGVVHAVDVNDRFAAAADTTGRVARLDRSGNPIEVIQVGSVNTFVSDLAIADDGTLWVLDAGAGQLHQVRVDGSVASHSPEGAALGSARGIGRTHDRAGMWVATTAGASLTRIDLNGMLVVVIPLPGRQPTDVVELPDASLWLVDAEQQQLVHVDAGGNELQAIAIDGFSSVEGPHLAHVEGTVYMSHPETSVVLAIDTASNELRPFAGALARPGGERLNKAIGIAVTGAGEAGESTIWVADSNAGALVTAPAG